MPKNDKEINTPEAPDDATDAKAVQKWQVWTQGPKDAKETKRKFKLTTPGQERDYKKLVGKRKFQRFEAVEQEDEDAPVNSVAGGGVDMAPNASGTKVFRKRRRLEVDGRSKAYRAATKRIKERNAKASEKDAVKKLSQFGVTNNPFAEEKEMDNNKYLKTKEGSIEQAALDSVEKKPYNPNTERPTLRLPKNRYLDTKEGSLERAVEEALSENGDHPPKGPHKHDLPRQLKDPKKEKMVGTKKGTVVVDRDDPKYKKHPEHEELEVEGKGLPPWLKGKGEAGQGAASSTDDDETDKPERRFDKQRERKRGSSGSSGLKKFRFKDKDKDDEEGKKEKKGRKNGKEDEDEDPVGKVKEEVVDENGNHPPKGRHQHPGQKKGSAKLKKGWKMTQSGEPYFVPSSNRPTRDKKESKEVVSGERDLGSDEYANYVKTLTPGEKAETDVHNRDARKAEVKQKKEKAVQNHQATRIDDVFDHQKLGFDTRADMLEFVLQHTGETEVTDENITSVYEILSGMTPKKSTPIPAGAKPTVLKPSLKGMDKTRKTIVKARRAGAIKPAGSSTEAVEVESLIAQAVAELSKKTLGRYVKSASHSAVDNAMALQRSSDKNQSRKDVEKHAGKVVRRQMGISRAADRLSKKEDMSLAPKGKGRKAAKKLYGEDKPEQGKVYALTGKSSEPSIARGDSWKKSEVKKKEKTKKEDASMIDAVREVLGLGGWKGSGIEKMPPVDTKTGKYKTGRSKITRLSGPAKKDVNKK